MITRNIKQHVAAILAGCSQPYLDDPDFPAMTDEVDDALYAHVEKMSRRTLFRLLKKVDSIDGDALNDDIVDNDVTTMLRGIVTAALKEEILRQDGFMERRRAAFLAAKARREQH